MDLSSERARKRFRIPRGHSERRSHDRHDDHRSLTPERVETVTEPRPLYDLLASTRVMIDVDLLAEQLPEGTTDIVAEGLRADTERLLVGDHQYAD